MNARFTLYVDAKFVTNSRCVSERGHVWEVVDVIYNYFVAKTVLEPSGLVDRKQWISLLDTNSVLFGSVTKHLG
jgi:hypothetical protein